MRTRVGRFSRLRTRTACLLGLALGLWSPSAALAQVADALIEVTAFDESGAARPAVTATLPRPDTVFQQSVVTDTIGVARGVALPPGSYTVKIELSGFA